MPIVFNKRLLNYLIPLYSILSGFLGVIAILATITNSMFNQTIWFIMMDMIFLILYSLMLVFGISELMFGKKSILRFLVLLSTFSISVIGLNYIFGGFYSLFLSVLVMEGIQFGIESNFGGRYSLYFNQIEANKFIFALNVIPISLLAIDYKISGRKEKS
ncbi:MAG: hypothetical protein RLN81_11340 [Balneolaceae bacterium]